MRRIVLDTDLAMGAPGSDVDDGFALAMAVADPDLSLELVTTVDGNTDVDTATRLSSELLDQLGRPGQEVLRGADGPLPDAGLNPAVVAIVDRVLAAPGEITLVAIGPLTNVALALRAEPRLAGALGELVIMGGTFFTDVSRAEFNARCDPEAAAVVLDSGVVARWVGLNVTEQVRLTRARATELAASEHAFTAFAGRQALPWIDQVSGERPLAAEPSCALHDPLAIAALARPDLLTWQPSRVRVETAGPLAGAMIAEPAEVAPNASVAVAVDADGFLAYFEELLERL